MKNRKLQSHIYYGWKVKDAIENAIKNPDVRLVAERRFKKSGNLLDTEKEDYFYLLDEEGYKVKLTKEEADYYLQLKGNFKDYR